MEKFPTVLEKLQQNLRGGIFLTHIGGIFLTHIVDYQPKNNNDRKNSLKNSNKKFLKNFMDSTVS